MKISGVDADNSLRIMPREMRMMTERVLSLTGLPSGFLLSLNDVVMFSQKLGLGGFRHLEQRLELLKSADPACITIGEQTGAELLLNCGGQHAWIALPAIANLLGELVFSHGCARIQLTNLLDADEVGVVEAMVGRTGLAASVEDGCSIVLARRQDDAEAGKNILSDLYQDGARISNDTWNRTYALAKKALATESIVSRRHAGALIVTDDGNVIGRSDNEDETDVGFMLRISHETTSSMT